MNATTIMPSPLSLRRMFCRNRRGQRGVVAIEFALVFLLGLLPLLLLTFSGVLIFAAKQSLTLAAANGARAALHYGATSDREINACQAAVDSMNWLFTLAGGSGTSQKCSSSSLGSAAQALVKVDSVACPNASASGVSVSCIQVTTSYDYENNPLMVGTGTFYSWLNKVGTITSSATIRIYDSSSTAQGS